jgi:hypothetical protein
VVFVICPTIAGLPKQAAPGGQMVITSGALLLYAHLLAPAEITKTLTTIARTGHGDPLGAFPRLVMLIPSGKDRGAIRGEGFQLAAQPSQPISLARAAIG